MTLMSVPTCISGEAIAEPANAPTDSASAESMVTSVLRFGGIGRPGRGIAHAVAVEPLPEQKDDVLSQNRQPEVQRELEGGTEQSDAQKARAQPGDASHVAAVHETVDHQLLKLQRRRRESGDGHR